MLNIRLGRYASKGCKRLIGEDLKENHCLIKKKTSKCDRFKNKATVFCSSF